VLEDKDLVPTGGYARAEDAGLDLRSGRSVAGLRADNVYWPRRPRRTAEILLKGAGRRISIGASANFGHMIVYSPPRRRFVCVENLTCSPNAQNLAAAGKTDVAGLTVLRPGDTARGWVRYTLRRVSYAPTSEE
jgi:galactose mutarotase-like enzyme